MIGEGGVARGGCSAGTEVAAGWPNNLPPPKIKYAEAPITAKIIIPPKINNIFGNPPEDLAADVPSAGAGVGTIKVSPVGAGTTVGISLLVAAANWLKSVGIDSVGVGALLFALTDQEAIGSGAGAACSGWTGMGAGSGITGAGVSGVAEGVGHIDAGSGVMGGVVSEGETAGADSAAGTDQLGAESAAGAGLAGVSKENWLGEGAGTSGAVGAGAFQPVTPASAAGTEDAVSLISVGGTSGVIPATEVSEVTGGMTGSGWTVG